MKKFICVLLALTFLMMFTACGDEAVSDSIIALTEPATTKAEIVTTTEPETEETTELQTTATTIRETTTVQTTVAQTITTTKVYTTATTTYGSSGGYAGGGGVTVPQAETGPSLVWVPVNGGTKYHSRSSCSNMIDPIQVSVDTAIANGYTACKRCW